MQSIETDEQDPLIAALPPATDYITYLTLLEYQLNTQNLSTLNRLLSDDDGTLAAEIGWDLLKMVLPMLQVVPDEATKCFDIISRRGNPREVIVRVAEELERLGHDDDSDDDLEDDQEDLPTFAGEATRIHLGEMKLDGMPDHPDNDAAPGEVLDTPSEHPEAESGSDDSLSLKALISMLSILHPRIKTQHPSRFLATSLPAALGAFRRLPMTDETTSDFIGFLGKLSGKQRPTLPPRTSTTGSSTSPTLNRQVDSTSTVPLPDPEGKSEEAAAIANTQANEKEIIQRLLQAVLLEVSDEYTNSFVAHDVMHMQWTNRLREKLEPGKVVPGRSTCSQKWQDLDLRARDELIKRILKLAKDLSLDPLAEFQHKIDASQNIRASTGDGQEKEEEDDDGDDDAEVTDYPQSPADIPLSTSALIMLQAAEKFYTNDTTNSIIELDTALRYLSELDSMDLFHSSPTSDAVLSLLFGSVVSTATDDTTSTVPPAATILKSLNDLEKIFTSNADASVRDNAHHIARAIFHRLADQSTKLRFLKVLLSSQYSEENAISSIQSGNLKSIAVNWLKEDFLSSTKPPAQSDPQRQIPCLPLSPAILSTEPDLIPLLLPTLPTMPGPFITSHPPDPTADSTAVTMSTETDLETFLLHIPFYISSLNLISILSSISPHHDTTQPTTDSVPTSTPSAPSVPSTPFSSTQTAIEHDHQTNSSLHGPPDLELRAQSFVQTLKSWQKGLQALLEGRNSGSKDGDEEDMAVVGMSDVYALEDAVTRAEKALSE